MNLAETVELIQKTAVSASDAKGKIAIVPLDRHTKLVVKPDGQHETHVEPPPPRILVAGNLAQFGPLLELAANQWGCSKPTVWYDGAGVVAVLDDDKDERRENVVTCRLNQSIEWTTLGNRRDQWYSQKDFVRYLRTVLWESLGIDRGDFLKIVRNISGGHHTEGRGQLSHTRESMGRSIEAEIRSETGSEIPDELELQVRVFEDPTIENRFTLKVGLDCSASDLKFNLFPINHEEVFDDALDAVHTILLTELGGKAIVFRGNPFRTTQQTNEVRISVTA